MDSSQSLIVEGVPGDEVDQRAFHGYMDKAVRNLFKRIGSQSLNVTVRNTPDVVRETVSDEAKQPASDELTTEQRAGQYTATEPLYLLNQLIVPADMMAQIELTIHAIRVEPLVYDTWGLRQIEPFPRSALNFHGEPGTGKTLAAHAIASTLGKKILVASYAQIESKFHGDGPKNVEALFFAAQRDEAILFMDEADSMLSRRLTNVTQGSEQAINSMRSQLLICLEKFRGVVIFATNLVENYDQAFETRVRHIKFPMPNTEARTAIWRKHLPSEMPLTADVDVAALVEAGSNFCGRDIKNAVINAATQAAIDGKGEVTQSDFVFAIQKINDARADLKATKNGLIADEPSEKLSEQIMNALQEQDAREKTGL
jgi:DNA polymerase III delta prime subunit